MEQDSRMARAVARVVAPVTRRGLVGGLLVGGGAAALAACASGSNAGAGVAPTAGPPKEVVVSRTSLGTLKDGAWAETLALAAKATGTKVTVEVEPANTYWDKRQAEFAGGVSAYDVIYNQPNWVLGGALKGMFVDLLPFFKKDKIDQGQYYKADLDSWTWKGKLWGYPFQVEGETVFYSKQAFQQKGVPFPTKDWTTDDLLNVVQRLNDPANNRFALLVENNNLQYSMGTFMRLFGGKVLNDARNRALYGDDPSSIKGAEYDADLSNKYRVTPTAEATRTLPTGTRAMEGRLVAITIGDVSRNPDIRAALGADVDYLPVPKGPGGTTSARVYSNAWSILSQGKQQEEAWAVLKWTHTKEAWTGPQLNAVGWPPVKWASALPQWQEQFKGTRIADVQARWESAGHNQAVLPEGAPALTAANEPLQRALRGEITAREALRESADKLNVLFGQRPADWNQ